MPYCKQKCIYCDFYSGGNPDFETYLKAVAVELAHRAGELRGDSLSSVYIGGGTPSLADAARMGQFLDEVRATLQQKGKGIAEDAEITIEVNPEDVTEENARLWRKAGINRASMGIQSLDDAELSFIKRWHTAKRALEALKNLKQHFNNVSVDVIYGIPGQTPETLERTLDLIIEEAPQHISAYVLTYEPRTPLEVLRRKGEIKEKSEEEYLELEGIVTRKLKEGGYERYEISNYAMPGYRSRHNSGYWDGREYLGLGPSASSFDGESVRRTNKANIKEYLKYWEEGARDIPFYEEERLGKREREMETIFTALRRKEGIEMRSFEADYGTERGERLLKRARKWVENGKMTLKNGQLALSEKGIAIADYITGELI